MIGNVKYLGIAISVAVVAVSACGCVDTVLSDNRLSSSTAAMLGVSPGEVVISQRRSDGVTNTYYTAKTPKGEYACTVNGGGVLDVGLLNAPQCSPAKSR